jgi:hypothetical protein
MYKYAHVIMYIRKDMNIPVYKYIYMHTYIHVQINVYIYS